MGGGRARHRAPPPLPFPPLPPSPPILVLLAAVGAPLGALAAPVLAFSSAISAHLRATPTYRFLGHRFRFGACNIAQACARKGQLAGAVHASRPLRVGKLVCTSCRCRCQGRLPLLLLCMLRGERCRHRCRCHVYGALAQHCSCQLPSRLRFRCVSLHDGRVDKSPCGRCPTCSRRQAPAWRLCPLNPKPLALLSPCKGITSMASLTQCPSSAALRPGHRRGGAAAVALPQPLAARAPAAVQGRRRALVVLAAHKASTLGPRGARQPELVSSVHPSVTLDVAGRGQRVPSRLLAQPGPAPTLPPPPPLLHHRRFDQPGR